MPALAQRTVARVLVDESHGQAWTIRPEVAAAVNPAHPGDSSYAAAARLLADRDFAVAPHVEGPLTAAVLADVDVLVLPHMSDSRFEKVVPGGTPVLSADELDAIEAFVATGGGLVVLAEEEQAKYGSNLDALLARFGIAVDHALVQDYGSHRSIPTWVLAEPVPAAERLGLWSRVDAACFYRTGTVRAEGPEAVVVARTSGTADPAHAGLVAVAEHGRGRVVALADSDLVSDDCIDDFANARLWLNAIYWAALPAFEEPFRVAPSAAAADPAWLRLRDAADALRLLQDPRDASLPADADRVEAAALVATMRAALVELAPRFPHEAEYLAAVDADLARWVEGGFARPDFTAALAAFHPERHRVDGIEHLVVFPQYTPNGSQDRRFEAMILRGPWPAFIAELEATRFDNAAFVPVEMVDCTAGYRSECVVVFPETVVVQGTPANAYGAILCDREARRFQRSTRRAAEILRLTLPPELAALTASYDLCRDTYILWDLIHDRWHSHGDLPFDPFMIRQRLPFWMYSLEELRVDLATFADARRLADEGFAFARYVMYAIALDRILRFPITGSRVRNYDGLGGQLLFAFLHGRDVVRWTDNRLEVDWDALPEAVEALKEQVDALYKSGIDRSKVAYWAAAHDLIAAHVEPNVASVWRADRRQVDDETDPRRWIDAVMDDEFPLSLFYVALKEKVATLDAAEAEQALVAVPA